MSNIQTRILSWLPFGWVRKLQRGPDGERYMDRYSVRQQQRSGSNPWRVYLHRFLAPDSEGHHNHPSVWGFSIVLWGSYTEEVLEVDPYAPLDHDAWHQVGPGIWTIPFGRSIRTRRVHWFNWIPASKYHRIVALHPRRPGGAVWTLFIPGPLAVDAAGKPRGWGFHVAGKGHVPWEEHIGPQPLAVPTEK